MATNTAVRVKMPKILGRKAACTTSRHWRNTVSSTPANTADQTMRCANICMEGMSDWLSGYQNRGNTPQIR